MVNLICLPLETLPTNIGIEKGNSKYMKNVRYPGRLLKEYHNILNKERKTSTCGNLTRYLYKVQLKALQVVTVPIKNYLPRRNFVLFAEHYCIKTSSY